MIERGKQQLVHDGETFNQNRHNIITDKSSWRCMKRKCNISVATIADEIVSISGEDGHKNIPCKEEVEKNSKDFSNFNFN